TAVSPSTRPSSTGNTRPIAVRGRRRWASLGSALALDKALELGEVRANLAQSRLGRASPVERLRAAHGADRHLRDHLAHLLARHGPLGVEPPDAPIAHADDAQRHHARVAVAEFARVDPGLDDGRELREDVALRRLVAAQDLGRQRVLVA